MPSASIRRHVTAVQLAVALLALSQLLGGVGVQAILWSRALQTELAIREFGGVRLCAANASQSATIAAQDAYSVPSPSLPGLVYTVRSQFTVYVLGCGLPASPQGIYFYLRAYLVSEVHWDDVCANTRSLTIFLSSSVGGNDSFPVQPCNYTVAQAGTSQQQVTAWVLVTYSADWSPDWVNRTTDYPEADGAASVILRSDTEPQRNATWTNVVTSGLPASPMSPGQKAQAALASVSTTTNWWLLICGALNASRNLLVSARSHGSNETLESYMNCRTGWNTLVQGAPTAEPEKPTIVMQGSGYWGRELRRQVMAKSFSGIAYCAIDSNSSILVTATDDVVASPGGAVVRGSFSAQLTPCSTSSSLALGDAYLKTFLRAEANWTDVCANSVNPVVTVGLTGRTAVQFRPCPPSDADSAATSAKAVWCILTLNATAVELQWISREAASLVEPNAVSVTFRVFGDVNGTTVQWGNVLVNGTTTGDQVDGMVQALKVVDMTYWPVICQLVNASVDRFLSIEITGSGNSSRPVNLYGNCSVASELSTTPPTGSLTTVESSITTNGFSSAGTPTPTQISTPKPSTTTTTRPTATTTRPTTTTTTTTATTTTPTITTTTPTAATTTPTTTRATTTITTSTTTESSSTAAAITPGVRSGGSETATTAITTLSPDALRALQNQQNLEAVKSQQKDDELRTQIAVISAALLVLLFMSTVGLCKMVLPRAA